MISRAVALASVVALLGGREAIAEDSVVRSGAAADGIAPETKTGAPVARAHLTDGNRLFKATRYHEALGEYQQAFAAYPSPKLHFNLGQTYRLLGRNDEARASFTRFLAEAADAPPELRAEAGAYLALLSPPGAPAMEYAGSTTGKPGSAGGSLVHDPSLGVRSGAGPRRWPIWVAVGAAVVVTGAAAIYLTQSDSLSSPAPSDLGHGHAKLR